MANIPSKVQDRFVAVKKISPGVKIENEEIKNVLLSEVLKREVVEGEKADAAIGRKSTKP